MMFVIWYIAEQEDYRIDRRMTEKHGRSWEKHKEKEAKKAKDEMMRNLGSAGAALGMFTQD